MRSLDPEEAALWAKVTATIRPLSRDVPLKERELAPEAPTASAAAPQKVGAGAPTQIKTRQAPAMLAAPRPGTTLDGSWDKRLAKGLVSPDRTIDLHGHNLDGAWSAIDEGIERAIAAGDRVVLLITGHYRSGEPPILRGRIRAAVHDWLAHSRHARNIAAVRGAHPRHGGGGSLYLILRRPR